MPKTYDSIPDIEDSVLKPIIHHLAEIILANTELEDHVGLSYKGTHDLSALPGSKLGSSDYVVWSNDDGRAKATIDDKIDLEREPSRVVDDKDGRWVCNDPDLRLGIYPLYEPRILTITLNYRDASPQSVMRWRDNVRRVFRNGMERMMLEATYSYAIPKFSRAMMLLVHKSAQEKLPIEDRESLADWYGRVLTRNLVMGSDIKGESEVPLVRETQSDILGYLTDLNPEIETNPETSQSSVEFVYEILYDCPKAMSVNFPIFANNTRIPKAFIPMPKYDPKDIIREYGNSGFSSAFFTERERMESMQYGYKLPYYDEWVPPKYFMKRYMPVLTITIAVDPDTTHLLNLGQLGRITLRPELLDHLRRRGNAITSDYLDLFTLTLFENEVSIEDTILHMDSDLNVSINEPLNVRKTYRLILGLNRELHSIPKEHINDIRLSGSLMRLIAQTVGIDYPETALSSEGVMNTADFVKLIELYATKMKDPSNGYQLMITVCTFLALVSNRS